MNSKLTINRVSKSFGNLRVLRDIELSVRDGEFAAIVGPSGCGKTTLLRLISGIETADSGSILVDGKPVNGPGPDRGFVFQQDCLFPWRTIWHNTVFGLEVNKQLDERARSRTEALLRLVGLSGFETYYPNQISGGMRQRANLARALALDPQVLIMDEPFSALDAQTRDVMQIELLRIWDEGKKTVLFITHQLEEAVLLADRVIVLGRRPGYVKEEIEIDLPRPRTLSMKRNPKFSAYVERLWTLIENDVQASVREEAQLAQHG
jgi:NitT/TauT family transport system ATP-binding protein